MRYLLDTCTFLWLALPQGRLSSLATSLINDASNELYLSDVSVWEVSLKHSGGKLPLPDSPRKWVPSRAHFFQLQQLPITEESIFRSGELPRVHGDPFDRLIAAQALEAGMILLSPDTPLSLLGAARVW